MTQPVILIYGQDDLVFKSKLGYVLVARSHTLHVFFIGKLQVSERGGTMNKARVLFVCLFVVSS